MLGRRRFLAGVGSSAAALLADTAFHSSTGFAAQQVTLPFANGGRPLVQYLQKRPLLQLTSRPPQLETPFTVFDEGVLTPNDAFFVRYHLANLPLNLDPELFALEVSGDVRTPMRLSLAELRAFAPVELVAVCQCSGNSRGFFEPRTAGGQLGNGAMGNARWKGVPLRAVLDRAGIRPGARQVAFNGLDSPVGTGTPDFVKALDIEHARDGEVMLAYEMNGETLPMLNGFPLRLIVPGYFGTYWVKHLHQMTVLSDAFDGFWMRTAYRIPDNACACVPPGTAPQATVPINRLSIRSFITNVGDGARVPANRPLSLKGIAFDSGYGINRVSVSTNGGASWIDAVLGTDLGKYSFREWQLTTTLGPGAQELKVRAANRRGETQSAIPSWNPAGYMRNVIETVRVTAA